MKTNTSYQENHKTLPISTKLAYWPFLIIPVSLIAGLSILFISSYFKVVIIVSSLILVFTYEAFRRFRLKEIKRQRYTIQKPYAWKINAPEHRQHTDFEMLKRQLIALQNTSNKSLLFIIERVTPEDHQAHLYESIFQDLKKENILVERFFERGDKKLFWTEGYPEEISAEELTSKYHNWLPIFCTDGLRFIDTDLEALADVIFPFYIWKNPILLTNRPALSWSYEEELLSVVFKIVSFNLTGVEALPKLVNARPGQHHHPLANEKHELIIKDDEKEIPKKLQAHFGEPFTKWVAATALCSKLDWDLTLKIGKYLSKNYDTPNDHTSLRQLSRLGWFRVGEMPEQVRKQLIKFLPINLQNEIRGLIVEAMEASPPPIPSHAHNSYRMELVSHKLLIPNFPQENLKEEFFELKSMGYLEEVGASEIVNLDTGILHKFLPPLLAERLFNNGNAMLGWNMKMILPLVLAIATSSAFILDKIISIAPPTNSSPTHLIGNIKDIYGNTIEGATVNSNSKKDISDSHGNFKLETSKDIEHSSIDVFFKHDNYFDHSQNIELGKGNSSITLLPKKVEIRVVEKDNENRIIDDAVIRLRTNALLDKNYYTKKGIATLFLKNKYNPNGKIKISVTKEGYISQAEKIQFQYNQKEKIVYLELEKEQEDSKNEEVPEVIQDIEFEGKLTNHCNAALSNVLVNVIGYGNVNTDANGDFRIKISPNSKNDIKVKFSKVDYYSEEDFFTLNQLKNHQSIVLQPEWITISVLDENEKTIKGATVTIKDYNGKKTNDSGFSKIKIKKKENCEINININYKDYNTINGPYEITEEQIVINLTKKDTPSCPFKRKVIDNCGIPLSGVKIKFKNNSSQFITNSNGQGSGNLNCTSIENSAEVTFSKQGYHQQTKTISTNQLNNNQKITLSKNSIKVIIRDAVSSQFIKNASIQFSNGKIGKMNSAETHYIVPLEKGASCKNEIFINHPKYPSYSGNVELNVEPIEINLTPRAPKPPKEFKIEITNKCGPIIQDAKVHIKDYSDDVKTNELGEVSIPLLIPSNINKVTVVVAKKGYHTLSEDFTIEELGTVQSMVLEREVINVQVTDEKGNQLNGVSVFVGEKEAVTTDRNVQYSVDLAKGEDCNQKVRANLRGYQEYENNWDLKNEKFSITLIKSPREPEIVEEEFTFEVNVKRGILPILNAIIIVKPASYDGKKLIFKKEGLVYKLKVTKSLNPSLYKYILDGGKISVSAKLNNQFTKAKILDKDNTKDSLKF